MSVTMGTNSGIGPFTNLFEHNLLWFAAMYAQLVVSLASEKAPISASNLAEWSFRLHAWVTMPGFV